MLFDSAKKVIPKATAKTIIPITKYNMVFCFKVYESKIEQLIEEIKQINGSFTNDPFGLMNEDFNGINKSK